METVTVSGKPRAGDLVLMEPAIGVHGFAEPWWGLVVATQDALSGRHMYLRVVPADDLESGRVRLWYVSLRGMRVRREVPR